MVTLYLIRHGETEWNATGRVMGRSDTPLNTRGESQALSLAKAMTTLPLNGIYSSPQLRARQTAGALSALHGIPVAVDEGLAEVDFPLWVGKMWKDLEGDPVFRRYHESPSEFKEKGFESLVDVQVRMAATGEGVASKSRDGSFALVSHADPLRTLLTHLLQYPLKELRRFHVSNASLSVLEQRSNRWNLKLFNYRPEIDLYSDV